MRLADMLVGVVIGIGIGALLFRDGGNGQPEDVAQNDTRQTVQDEQSQSGRPSEEASGSPTSISTESNSAKQAATQGTTIDDNSTNTGLPDKSNTVASAKTTTPVPSPVIPKVRTEDIPDVTPTTLSPNLVGFLRENCQDCHSGNDPEGGLSLETNAVAFADAEIRRRWTYLYDRVANGEMPPPSADQPNKSSTEDFLRSLGGILIRADLSEREVVLRWLNHNEYTNTVSDLFGVYVDVSRILLDDSTQQGFDNIGSELSISSEQMQTYVKAANAVLDHVLGPERPPETTTRTANFKDSNLVGSDERKLADGIVLFSADKFMPLYKLSAAMPGLYRVKVKVRLQNPTVHVVRFWELACHQLG